MSAPLRQVAVLCVARQSIYRSLPGVDCYDDSRDVRTFGGNSPIVAHPPCRSWSNNLRHQAIVPPGEAELGLLCASWLRACGGILEHPAHSHLFEAARLPKPGQEADGLWTLAVLQSWWGDPRAKKTWLCFSGIHPALVRVPCPRRKPLDVAHHWWRMSRRQRSATPPLMASWLVRLARLSVPPGDLPASHPSPAGLGLKFQVPL